MERTNLQAFVHFLFFCKLFSVNRCEQIRNPLTQSDKYGVPNENTRHGLVLIKIELVWERSVNMLDNERLTNNHLTEQGWLDTARAVKNNMAQLTEVVHTFY